MKSEQRDQYIRLINEFLAVEGNPDLIENYNIKKRKLNKLGKLSVEDRKNNRLTDGYITNTTWGS